MEENTSQNNAASASISIAKKSTSSNITSHKRGVRPTIESSAGKSNTSTSDMLTK